MCRQRKLAEHLQRYLKKNDTPLHSQFATYNTRQTPIEVSRVLSCADSIAEGLIGLESKLERSGLTLDQGIEEELGEPLNLFDELGATEFLNSLASNRPLFDSGVSPVHGKYAHALQQYILEHILGKEKFEDLLNTIRSSPILDCEHMPDRKWTLWDEYLDRPTPYTIKNCQRRSCREALLTEDRNAVTVPSCLDGRSPEWLTTVIALTPDDCGIPMIHDSISRDLSKRGENVHQDIFITGFENLDYLNKLEFKADL